MCSSPKIKPILKIKNPTGTITTIQQRTTNHNNPI